MLIACAVPIAAQQASAKDPATTTDTSTNPHAVQPERPTVATHAGTVATGWL